MNTRNSKTADEAKIRALIDERANALRNKDARGVISHHAEDFVQFSLAPPLIATDANVKGFEAWFATWQGQLGYEPRQVAFRVRLFELPRQEAEPRHVGLAGDLLG